MARLAVVALLSSSPAAADTGPWRDGVSLPVGLGGHAVGLSEGRLLLAGGTTWRAGRKCWRREVYACDPAAGAWEQVGALPEPVAYAGTVSSRTALYILGGGNGRVATARCYRLRLREGRLVTDRLPDLPEPRIYAAGARVGPRLYMVGGATDPDKLNTATASLVMLDLGHLERGWQVLADLPGPTRVIHAAAAAGRFIYVCGGCRVDDQRVLKNLADAYRYDTRAHRWERLPDMPAANRALTALGAGSREILLFGGFTASEEECAGKGDAFGFSDAVLSYDPWARSYRQVARLPVATACAVPIRVGDKVFLLGGEPVKRQRGDWVWISRLSDL